MQTGALHVQHKNQDVHDAHNRVIPNTVVAVSSDTGEVRFGDGVTRWRSLPYFGGGNDRIELSEGDNGEGYNGPLHVVVFTDEEIMAKGASEAKEYVPSANEMVLFGTLGVFFGNGVQSLNYLSPITPASSDETISD